MEVVQLTDMLINGKVPILSDDGVIHPQFNILMQKRDQLAETFLADPEIKRDESLAEVLQLFNQQNVLLGEVISQTFQQVKTNLERIRSSKKAKSAYSNLRTYSPTPLFFDDMS